MNKRVWFRRLAVLGAGHLCFPVFAQTLDVDGAWRGQTTCPAGAVAFTLDIKGTEGSFTYAPASSIKSPTKSLAVKVSARRDDMHVSLYSPGQDKQGVAFGGDLLADGSIRVFNPQFGTEYCDPFSMLNTARATPEPQALLDAKGLDYETFMISMMQGNFAAIRTPADDPSFNDLFGSYLFAYAEQCGADPKTRPANFVEMTNLECVEKGVTTTYYRNGAFSESAPYCTQWKDVPNGYYADPKLWEAKQKLDDRFLRDTYKNVFAALKGSGLGYRGPIMPNVKKMAEAIAARAQDMTTLVQRNGCDGPGLMRFQENLRLYALNQPFGIRGDGTLTPAIPIPAPGSKYEDPDFVSLLEELIKGEARSWQVNKYVLKSIAGPQIASRDDLGRPREVSANYRYGGLSGVQTGKFRVTFVQGYPECLYFSDRPQMCRSPDKKVVSKYVHGLFSPRSLAAAAPAPDPAAEAQKQQEREVAAAKRRSLREKLH
ncbi:hypothetical protein [Pusillimonas sp.]|uniref:hypothetical protein n=1 Tax=Pusillimonas sp. TaxID=3040095 RepID=UPI0037CBCBE2